MNSMALDGNPNINNSSEDQQVYITGLELLNLDSDDGREENYDEKKNFKRFSGLKLPSRNLGGCASSTGQRRKATGTARDSVEDGCSDDDDDDDGDTGFQGRGGYLKNFLEAGGVGCKQRNGDNGRRMSIGSVGSASIAESYAQDSVVLKRRSTHTCERRPSIDSISIASSCYANDSVVLRRSSYRNSASWQNEARNFVDDNSNSEDDVSLLGVEDEEPRSGSDANGLVVIRRQNHNVKRDFDTPLQSFSNSGSSLRHSVSMDFAKSLPSVGIGSDDLLLRHYSKSSEDDPDDMIW